MARADEKRRARSKRRSGLPNAGSKTTHGALRGWSVPLAIAVLAVVPYLQTLGFDYVLDDLLVVRDHPLIAAGRCAEAGSTSYWPEGSVPPVGNWRPLASAAWCIERGGGTPAASASTHHGVNLVLYALVVLALYPVARRLTGSQAGAWITCALFAVHPAHTQVVAPMVGRTDLLAALGALLLCSGFWRHRETGAPAGLIVATLGFAIGLGGKESAAPMLAVLPLADRLLFGRSFRSLLGRGALAYLPLVFVAAIYMVARTAIMGETSFVNTNADEMGLVGRLGFAARNTVYSLALLVAPVRMHHLLSTLPTDAPYTFPPPGPGMAFAFLLAALPIWLGWVALVRRAPSASVSWLAALLPWIPTSGLLAAGAGLGLRFLFLPSAFALCGVVYAARQLVVRRPRFRTPLLAAAAVWGLAGLVLSWQWIPAWKDDISLYSAVIAQEPDSYTARYGLGAAIGLRGGDLVEARRHLSHAIAIAGENPGSINARLNLAISYEYGSDGRRFGPGADIDKARATYRDALRIAPDFGPAAANAAALAELLSDRARSPEERRFYAAEALDAFEAALRSLPGHSFRDSWHRSAARCASIIGRRRDERRHLMALAEVLRDSAEEAERSGRTSDAAAARSAGHEALEAALTTEPPTHEAERIRELLDSLRHGDPEPDPTEPPHRNPAG